MIHVTLTDAVNPVLVPFAKKLARRCLKDNIRYKIYRVLDTTILVETWANGLAKVYLTGTGIHGYQFIYPGPTVTMSAIQGLDYYVQTQGSAVFVKLPKIPKDGTALDWEKTRYYATGSTLEYLPTDPPKEPSTDITTIEKVDNLIQVQLIPEPVWVGYKDYTKSPNNKVLYSWSGSQGEIYGSGFRMLVDPTQLTDIGYDLPPTVLGGAKPLGRMPDADWPNEGCRVQVTSEQFGTRNFIVMTTANSRFWCWPDSYDSKESLVPPGSPYIQQAIKTNVPEAKYADPPYPAWVHAHPEGFTRRDTSFSQISLEPRYVWRFHPKDLKVVGHVLQRDQFTESVWATKVPISETPDVPLEEEVIDDLKIYTGWANDGSVEWDDIYTDLPGWVEIGLNIEITGTNKEDFTFGLSLLREQQTNNNYYPIAVGYLSPIYNKTWEEQGYSASPGDLVMISLDCYNDQTSEDWIYKDVGLTDSPTNYLRQVFATVINVETNEVLKKFLILEYPSGHTRLQTDTTNSPYYITRSEFIKIELEKLSFAIVSRRLKYTFDASSYYDFTADNSVAAGTHQRWVESETGLRCIAFGEVVKEQSEGTDLGLFAYLDAADIAVGDLKVSPTRTATRWLYSGVVQWDHNDLLSESLFRMAPNLDQDHANLAEFRTNVMDAKVLNGIGGLGGYAGLLASNTAYTQTYWDDFIVPTAWEILQTTNAMRTAGDNLPVETTPSIYSHAYFTYRTPFIYPDDIRLRTGTSDQLNQHVYDFPVGSHLYKEVWGLAFNNQAEFPLVTSWDGFYATYHRQHYISGRIPEIGVYLGTASGKRVSRTVATSEGNFTIFNARDSLSNQPSVSQFQFFDSDAIGHIQGGETSHAVAYSEAYEKPLPEIPLPVITVYNDQQYTYTKTVDYERLGQSLQKETSINEDTFYVEQPRFNGAAYFL